MHYSRAEQIVAEFMHRQGWAIVARNYRLPAMELDIVARKARTLVICEVKFRAYLGGLVDVLSWRKRAALLRGAQTFVRRNPDGQIDTIRIDLAALCYQFHPTLAARPQRWLTSQLCMFYVVNAVQLEE